MSCSRSLNEAQITLVRMAAGFNARNARGRDLPSIVLMTDDGRDADWVTAVRALPRGAAVVVRHRIALERERLARSLAGVCAARGVKILIADDLGLALRVRADGVHLPQARMALIAAARACNPRWLVTISAHGAASVGAAARLGADAIFVAPVFGTFSHPGRSGLGVVRLAALSHATRTPVYALGGIDAESVRRLPALPLCGIALISGWLTA